MRMGKFGVKAMCAGAVLLLASGCSLFGDDEEMSQDTTGGQQTQTSTAPATTTTTAAPSSSVSASEQVIAGTQEDLILNVGDRVHFDYDKHDLMPEGQATIERWTAWLKRYPSLTVTVEGHADERGTREYNLGLGERRANSARQYMIALGISGDRVATISYGKERPECTSHNEGCWRENRRSVLQVN